MQDSKVKSLLDHRLKVTSRSAQPAAAKPRLLDQVREAIRTRHYSPKTEDSYVGWIKRFILFHSKRHPVEMAEKEIGQFLTNLAVNSRVSATTQNQALNALLFLYNEVLRKEIGYVNGVVRAKRSRRVPVVLTREEVRLLLGHLYGTQRLMATLLYGAGLRLMECCRLRVKDIDFDRNEITIRAGKGNKDRHTMLPHSVKNPLAKHLQIAKGKHQNDLEQGLGRVTLPNALDRKYPNAGIEWAWQWVFRLQNTMWIRRLASITGIICTNRSYRKQLKKQFEMPKYPNLPVATHLDIPLLPTCWKMDTIFELSKNCLVTRR